MGYWYFIFAALFIVTASAQDTASEPLVRRQLPAYRLLTWDFSSFAAEKPIPPLRLPTIAESIKNIRPILYVDRTTPHREDSFDLHFEPNGRLSTIRRKPRLGEGPVLRRLWYGLTKNYSLSTFGFAPVHRYSLDEIAVLNRDVRYSSISVGTGPYGNRMVYHYSHSPMRLIRLFLKPAQSGLSEEFRPGLSWRKH